MPLKTITNGIDVDRLRALASEGAQLAASVPAIRTEWVGGTETRTDFSSAEHFAIRSDYPEPLLGSGSAPSPLELLVTSVTSSFVTSFVLAAAAVDVRIEAMRVRTAVNAGDATARPSRDMPRPIADLVLIAELDTAAPLTDLRHLCAIASERAPVLALCKLNVRVDIKRVKGSTP